MKRLVAIIFFLAFSQINAQTGSVASHIDAIKEMIAGSHKKLALKKIDSLLSSDIQPEKKQLLKVLKVEALVGSHLFDEALVAANHAIEDTVLVDSLRIKVLLERALLYEYVNQFDVSWRDLERVKKHYDGQGIPKDHLYGAYLYRTASWYRVQDKDSMARAYAMRANNFGQSHNYDIVIATANMILALTEEDEISLAKYKYTQRALENFEKANDNGGAIAMVFSHAEYYKKKGEFNKAIKYLDTLQNKLRGDKELLFRSRSAKLRSEMFQEMGRLDSALFYYKRFKELSEEELLYEQEIRVNEIKYDYELQKDKLQNELLEENLAQAKSEKNYILIASAVLFVLLLLVGLLLYLLSLRNKYIKSQSNEISEYNASLKKSISEKEFLLRESFHRIKNNLALVLGLVKFQKNEFEKDSYAQKKFINLENRIGAIALAHRNFMPSSSQKDSLNYNLKEYLKLIVDSLIHLNGPKVAIDINIETISISMDTALPIGIIVNELISNTLKHADPVAHPLEINLRITKIEEVITINYSDNGTVFNPQGTSGHLGLFIIKSMVQQLDGTMKRNQSTFNFKLKVKNDA